MDFVKFLRATFFLEHLLWLLLKEILQKETLSNENLRAIQKKNYSGILRTGTVELNPV